MAKLILNPTLASRREIPLSFATVLTIGRDPSNDVVLPDSMVSRRHAVVERRAGQFVLRDCNSANGSVVNGNRVNERGLRDGDQVAIGTARLVFREDADSASGKVVLHPSAAPFHCRGCGAEYRRGDAFCRGCGAPVTRPVERPRRICEACGAAVPAPARFCNACGRPLSEQGADGPADADSPPPSALHAEPAAPRSAGSLAFAPEHRTIPRSARARRAAVDSAVAEPAEAGSRLGAALVDGVFVLSAQAVMVAPVLWYWWSREVPRTPADVPFLPVLATVVMVLLAVLLGGVYHVYFWTVKGATPGKELFDLRVQTEDGRSPIDLRRAVLRALGYCAGVASLGIGFLTIAFGDAGLHDRLAGTRVVRTWLRRDERPPQEIDAR